jgi:hypothetical protein
MPPQVTIPAVPRDTRTPATPSRPRYVRQMLAEALNERLQAIEVATGGPS